MKQYFLCFFVLGLLINAARASSSQTTYEVKEQSNYQQTDPSTLLLGYSPLGYNQYGGLNASVTTDDGASLSAAPILGLPGPTSTYPTGSITFPTGADSSPTHATGSGYNNYWVTPIGNNSNVADLAANVGSGTFTFYLGNATAMPTLTLDVANPNFPATPMATSISGGTWSGGAIVVNAGASLTLNFNTSAFTTYESGLGGIINYQLLNSSGVTIIPKPQSVYVPDAGYTQSPLSSFTINAGTLIPGESYIVQADYFQVEDVNTTDFTGTGITGNPLGLSEDFSSTFINIEVVPEPSTASLVVFSGVAGLLYTAVSRLRRKG